MEKLVTRSRSGEVIAQFDLDGDGLDVAVNSTDADGNATPGWRRVRPRDAFRFREELIRIGLDRAGELPAGVARDRVAGWVRKLANEDGPVPPGVYPLGDGERAVCVLSATERNLQLVRYHSNWAESVARALHPPRVGSRVSLTDAKAQNSAAFAAVAKARAVLNGGMTPAEVRARVRKTAGV